MVEEDQSVKPRRRFFRSISRVAMWVGLAGGYGGFGLIAARYLYPGRGADGNWLFVSEIDGFAPGDAVEYRVPSGERINIARRGDTGSVEDFVALSTTCPHLGCQVTWEPQADRFFCPCHNGVFDRSGVGVSGPPGDAGQSLAPYPLRIDNGLLFVQVRTRRLAGTEG